jgi:hypothetical protein
VSFLNLVPTIFITILATILAAPFSLRRTSPPLKPNNLLTSISKSSSGQLNAKHRELLELQARAQRRLKSSRANFEDGVKAAKEVKRDLEWTQRKVT